MVTFSSVHFFTRFLKDTVRPVVHTELQLLYVFHLIGPYIPRYQHERTRCMMDVSERGWSVLLRIHAPPPFYVLPRLVFWTHWPHALKGWPQCGTPSQNCVVAVKKLSCDSLVLAAVRARAASNQTFTLWQRGLRRAKMWQRGLRRAKMWQRGLRRAKMWQRGLRRAKMG